MKILESNKIVLHKKLFYNLISKSLELDPNFFGTYHLLGVYYEDLCDYVRAENCYKKSIDLNTKNISSYHNLYQLYFNDYYKDNSLKFVELDNLFKKNKQKNPFYNINIYSKEKNQYLKFKFEDSELIGYNYSQSYQDMFVLSMLNGKKNGTYVEIGSNDYFFCNNTFLLEKNFNWKGIGVEIEEQHVNLYNKKRKNPCVLKDATKIDYEKFFFDLQFPQEIDYLQLDCDPPSITYEILLSIPFDKYKFAVITYEHDYYCDDTKSFQEKSKVHLESYGYLRVVNNISVDENKPFEDWWVHPDLIDKSIISKIIWVDNQIKVPEKIFFYQ